MIDILHEFIEWLINQIKPVKFLKWVAIDIYRLIKYGRKFDQYGVTLYCGKQGAGKTIGMVYYLEWVKERFPDCLIYTNFDYAGRDGAIESPDDLLSIRNGIDGVVFAIDEISSEWNSSKWANFDENLLREISQQRKQRIKIIGSAQTYGRVVKQIREQCFEVVECRTLGKRWTFMRCFDAEDYNAFIENPSPDKKKDLPRKWRKSFVADDDFRDLYDTYEKVERLKKVGSVPRSERLA